MTKILDALCDKIKYLNRREIEGVLHVLATSSGLTNNQFIQATGMPRETAKSLKSDMGFLLKKSETDSIAIRDEFLTELQAANLRPYCWRLINISAEDIEEHVATKRKEFGIAPNRDLDQFYATPNGTASKVKILDDIVGIENTRIAVLGDDDLVSLGINYLNPSYKSLTVFDADAQLLSKLSSIAPISTLNYDALNPVPLVYQYKYDVVVTDPPYTKKGVQLFLNRSLELLDTWTDGRYIFLYYGTSTKTPEKALRIQELINDMGLVIENCINRFVSYTGAEGIGDVSTLYVLKTTSQTRQLPVFIEDKKIYTHQTTQYFVEPPAKTLVVKLKGIDNAIVASKTVQQKILGQLLTQYKLKVLNKSIKNVNKNETRYVFELSNGVLLFHIWDGIRAGELVLEQTTNAINFVRFGQDLSKLFKCANADFKV